MNAYADAGQASKEAMDTVLKSLSAVTKGFQQIAAETGDFAKRNYESSSRFAEELAQTRTPDKALELQSAYLKNSYEAWVAQASKIGDIYAEVARESFKPFENGVAKATNYAQNAAPDAN